MIVTINEWADCFILQPFDAVVRGPIRGRFERVLELARCGWNMIYGQILAISEMESIDASD